MSPKKSGDTLEETAREIGSRLGEVKAKASRVLEGVKAAVKASTAHLKGGPKKADPKRAAKKKTASKRKAK
jgi:hypothetical protein